MSFRIGGYKPKEHPRVQRTINGFQGIGKKLSEKFFPNSLRSKWNNQVPDWLKIQREQDWAVNTAEQVSSQAPQTPRFPRNPTVL